MQRLKFGAFIAPFHKAGTNVTAALQRDLRTVEYMDEYGYDEVFIGEHHSAGGEWVSSPEIFIASAAERTKNIRLGTGVTSIAYHNPLWVADRMMLLDHLTRGRAILGMGPGSLPTDSRMIGLTPTDTRELLDVNVDIITRLVAGETVNAETKTHKLIDARLQMAPYTPGGWEMCVASVASPTGARIAGRYGIGLLSIGATLTKEGFDALAHHWNVVEERAAEYGQTADRSRWRLVGPFHLAETEEQAHKDVEHGIEHWFDYFQKVAAFPQMAVDGSNIGEMIDFIKEAGIGVIGTPEQAREQIQRLWDQSNGGFGSILNLHQDWANPQATQRSYELMAQEVMPYFQGQAEPVLESDRIARGGREELAGQQLAAVDHMTKKYESELAAQGSDSGSS